MCNDINKKPCVDCAKCAEEAKKHEQAKINEAIEKAKKEAPAKGYSGQVVLILQRANGTGYLWASKDDDRAERLEVVDRVWIN